MQDIIDMRARLPRKAWEIGRRSTPPRYITLHYNGPAVATQRQHGNALLQQLIGDTTYQMRPGGLGSPEGGDGLQYHYVVGSDGAIWQTRDDDAVLWHCANTEGNAWSLSIHVPIGLGQTITDTHWTAVTDLFDLLMQRYAMPGRSIVRGHQEWSLNLCPGPHLMSRLKAWRQVLPFPTFHYYRVKRGIAIVRTEPRVHTGNEAKNPVSGKALTMSAGEATGIDTTVIGEWAGSGLGRSNQWLHRADGLGFIHAAAMERV